MQIEGLGGRRITGVRREEGVTRIQQKRGGGGGGGGGGGASRGAAICVQRQSGDHSLWGVGRDGGVLTFSLEIYNADKNHFAFQGEAV